MSSDTPRDLFTWRALSDTSSSCRLDSLSFALAARAFSALLAFASYSVVEHDLATALNRGSGGVFEPTALALALLGVAWFVWNTPKCVTATSFGLALGKGKKARLIPWPSVLDVRELPWIRFSPPWYPKRFQIDLLGDKRFDFVGRRNSRELVIQFVKRSESSAG